MRWRLSLVILVVAAMPWLASGQEQAFTMRATELKEKGASDARTVASLPENTAVKVLQRAGGWTRVEASGQSGWVRAFHLRFPSTVTESSSSGSALGGLTSALGFGRSKTEASKTSSIGIRGLTAEDFKNATPDVGALQRMQSYRVDKGAAERFAREARLASVSINYLMEEATAPSKGRR